MGIAIIAALYLIGLSIMSAIGIYMNNISMIRQLSLPLGIQELFKDVGITS